MLASTTVALRAARPPHAAKARMVMLRWRTAARALLSRMDRGTFSHCHLSAYARCALSFALCIHPYLARLSRAALSRSFLAASPDASVSCTAVAENQLHKVVGAQQAEAAHTLLEQRAKAALQLQWGSLHQ